MESCVAMRGTWYRVYDVTIYVGGVTRWMLLWRLFGVFEKF